MSEMIDPLTLKRTHEAQTFQGIPPTLRQVPFKNIGDLLDQRARTFENKSFLTYFGQPGEQSASTYAEFRRRVNQTANFMQAVLGLRRGDCLATITYNHPDVLLIYFAAWKLGAIVAPQNVAEDDRHIGFVLDNSEAQVVFAHRTHLERAKTILTGVPRVRQVVTLDGRAGETGVDFATAIAQQPTEFMPNEIPELDDECLLVYTSGTTGAPKGVVLTQYNLLVNAKQNAEGDAITARDRLMCVLPIHHVNGLVVTHVVPLYAGASVVLNRQFSSSTFWERLADERVTISSVVPTLLQFLIDDDQDISKYDLSALRFLICGAGTLSVTLAEKFERRFGVKLVHGYGLSETTAYACHLPVDLSPEEHLAWLTRHGYPSIGCPFDLNEMEIFDAGGEGRKLSEGERGEIAIRGHNVMKYYFRRPDANRETFAYGWFRSGDEGFFLTDPRGRRFFFITGRLKELVNRGGVKFSPFDVEEVLAEIPGVQVGLAVAFDNLYYGEEVGAYIVPRAGVTLEEAQILEHCAQKLGFAKCPKVVVFGKEVPVTATGKYQRLKLKPLFANWSETQFRESKRGASSQA